MTGCRLTIAASLAALLGCRSGPEPSSIGPGAEGVAEKLGRTLNHTKRGLAWAWNRGLESEEEHQIRNDWKRVDDGRRLKYHTDDVALSNHETELYWESQQADIERLKKAHRKDRKKNPESDDAEDLPLLSPDGSTDPMGLWKTERTVESK